MTWTVWWKYLQTINMSKIISIVNQKGGVAKTTTALALSVGFAKKMVAQDIAADTRTRKNEKILLADLDPQKNATSVLIPELKDEPENSIYYAFKSGKSQAHKFNLQKLIIYLYTCFFKFS